MAHTIKKLDGTTEFTLTNAEWTTMQSAIPAPGEVNDGMSTLPDGNMVWIYIMTDSNKDTLLGELVAAHGADSTAFRMSVEDTI